MKMLLTILLCLPMIAFAQVDVEASASLLKPVLEILVGFLPENVVAIIILMGSARFIFKPIMELFKVYSQITPGKKDDELYKEVSEGNTYKLIQFIFDYIASIKLPSKK